MLFVCLFVLLFVCLFVSFSWEIIICLEKLTHETWIERMHSTIRSRPYWCTKPIPWEFNSFLMQTLSFVSKTSMTACQVSAHAIYNYTSWLSFHENKTAFVSNESTREVATSVQWYNEVPIDWSGDGGQRGSFPKVPVRLCWWGPLLSVQTAENNRLYFCLELFCLPDAVKSVPMSCISDDENWAITLQRCL